MKNRTKQKQNTVVEKFSKTFFKVANRHSNVTSQNSFIKNNISAWPQHAHLNLQYHKFFHNEMTGENMWRCDYLISLWWYIRCLLATSILSVSMFWCVVRHRFLLLYILADLCQVFLGGQPCFSLTISSNERLFWAVHLLSFCTHGLAISVFFFGWWQPYWCNWISLLVIKFIQNILRVFIWHLVWRSLAFCLNFADVFHIRSHRLKGQSFVDS